MERGSKKGGTVIVLLLLCACAILISGVGYYLYNLEEVEVIDGGEIISADVIEQDTSAEANVIIVEDETVSVSFTTPGDDDSSSGEGEGAGTDAGAGEGTGTGTDAGAGAGAGTDTNAGAGAGAGTGTEIQAQTIDPIPCEQEDPEESQCTDGKYTITRTITKPAEHGGTCEPEVVELECGDCGDPNGTGFKSGTVVYCAPPRDPTGAAYLSRRGWHACHDSKFVRVTGRFYGRVPDDVLEDIGGEGVDWTTIQDNDPENKRDDCRDVPTTHYRLDNIYANVLGYEETDIGTLKACPVGDDLANANSTIKDDLCRTSKYDP